MTLGDPDEIGMDLLSEKRPIRLRCSATTRAHQNNNSNQADKSSRDHSLRR